MVSNNYTPYSGSNNDAQPLVTFLHCQGDIWKKTPEIIRNEYKLLSEEVEKLYKTSDDIYNTWNRVNFKRHSYDKHYYYEIENHPKLTPTQILETLIQLNPVQKSLRNLKFENKKDSGISSKLKTDPDLKPIIEHPYKETSEQCRTIFECFNPLTDSSIYYSFSIFRIEFKF
jgi:hypothetical protein